MTLTSRQKDITIRLLNDPRIYKVKNFSKKYNVSVRTIRSDLNKVSEWLNEQADCRYNSKPGKGIWVSFTSDSNRKKAIDSLQSVSSDSRENIQYYNPDQRKWRILTELVFSNNYLTGKELANLLNVSPNTFLSDLKNVRKEANKFQLKLISKNYYGYCLTGSEINVRSLMEFILQEHMDKYTCGINNLVNALIKISIESNFDIYLPKTVRKLISNVSLLLIDKFTNSNFQINNLNLNAVKSMINRLVIIIFENKKSENFSKNFFNRKINSKQILYTAIYRFVIKCFHVEPSKNEEKYFIFGANVSETKVEVNTVAREIINYVSNSLDLSLNSDMQLQDSLTQHLMNELNSNYQYFNDYTPFTDEVKNQYPKLFFTVKQALTKFISKNPVIISDTFITLISLHFLVSLNDSKRFSQIQVLYVCSSGLGATSLLQKLIQERIPYIRSVGFATVMNYYFKIQELKPDLVISIFPLAEVKKVPIIQVNPIPTEQDISAIQTKVQQLIKNDKFYKNSIQKNSSKSSLSINDVEKVLSLSLEAFIRIKEYFGNRINKKYLDAFMIHVQLATERIYFNMQYEVKPEAKELEQFSIKDVDVLKKIYKKLKLNISISEIVAILRYTLLK